MNPRCLNIDWLEVYALESVDLFPLDAEFFRSHDLWVRERDYGTRQYKQMFTILDQYGNPFCEIRRAPVSADDTAGQGGIFSPFSCHIRLVNRYCYHPDAIQLFTDFLFRWQYEVKHLYRFDLALDFTRFDKGDDPARFVERYLKGRYSKINQCNLSAHGKDRWDGRTWNSLSWGSPTSMVSTKLYNKTLELEEAHDKPYIRKAWQDAGLVDDYVTLLKRQSDGSMQKQSVWRVEFSIRSSARQWVLIEDNTGTKTKHTRRPHALGVYHNPEDRLHAFAYLAHHYFHFKYFKQGVRKDRCPDKVLFDFGECREVYKLDTLMVDHDKRSVYQALARRIREYRMLQADQSVRHACDVLLARLEEEEVRHDMPDAQTASESRLLQALIARRMKLAQDESFEKSLGEVSAYLNLYSDLF